MTTPGGVPNLPQGALTIDTLASKTQDMTQPAMRDRAAERFPNIFGSSSGGNALSDLTPFGILTQLFAGFNSSVANADPADIEGPEDLPGLLLDFIESLPVIGELIGLLEAILGTYDGDDEVLLQVQAIFAPIRALLELVSGVGLGGGFPSLEELTAGFANIPIIGDLVEAITGNIGDLSDLTSFFNDIPIIGDLVEAITGSAGGLGDLTDFFSDIPIIGDLVEAITGNSGGLGDLTSFFGGLVSLPDLVAALTGSPGDLPDLADWVNDIPLLSQIVGALTGGGGGLLDLSTWANGLAPLTILEDLIDGLGGTFGSTIEAVIARLENLISFDDDIPGGNLVGDIVANIPIVGDLLGGMFGALFGHNTSNPTTTQIASGLAGVNASVVGAQATLARFEAAFTSGTSVQDLFEFSASSGAGSNFQLFYSSGPGNVFVDGHNAAWDPPTLNATPRTVRALYIGANPSTVTDYQQVEVILNAAPQEPVSGFGQPAANDILLRCDTGMNNFIRIRFRGDDVVIVSRIVSGTETVMGTQALPVPLAASTRIGGRAGKLALGGGSVARAYIPLLNGFPLDMVTESGTASQIGSGYRGVGWGMFAGPKTDLVFIPGQTKPGSIKQWTASDQVAA